jgi:hypothetical protein
MQHAARGVAPQINTQSSAAGAHAVQHTLPSSLICPATQGACAGHALLLYMQDRTLRLWNPLKGLFIKEYRGHGYEVRDVSVCIDNSKMASVGGDRQVGR